MPSAALAGRLPEITEASVACGGSSVPTGSCRSSTGALVSTLPSGLAVQPCTVAPEEVTSQPLASKLNEPLRV